MKKLFTTIFLALLTSLLYACKNNCDCIHNQGKCCTYEIIELSTNKDLELKITKISDAYYYNTTWRKRVICLESKIINTHSQSNKVSKRHIVHWEAGYLFETSDYKLNQIKLNYVYSYPVNSYFSIGIGSGLRYYHFFNDGFIPLFADTRIDFYKSNITPYFALEAGCSIDLNQRFEIDYISPLINPSVGITFKRSNKSAINIGIGYEKQKLKVIYEKWYSEYASIKSKGAISLILGYSF